MFFLSVQLQFMLNNPHHLQTTVRSGLVLGCVTYEHILAISGTPPNCSVQAGGGETARHGEHSHTYLRNQYDVVTMTVPLGSAIISGLGLTVLVSGHDNTQVYSAIWLGVGGEWQGGFPPNDQTGSEIPPRLFCGCATARLATLPLATLQDDPALPRQEGAISGKQLGRGV